MDLLRAILRRLRRHKRALDSRSKHLLCRPSQHLVSKSPRAARQKAPHGPQSVDARRRKRRSHQCSNPSRRLALRAFLVQPSRATTTTASRRVDGFDDGGSPSQQQRTATMSRCHENGRSSTNRTATMNRCRESGPNPRSRTATMFRCHDCDLQDGSNGPSFPLRSRRARARASSRLRAILRLPPIQKQSRISRRTKNSTRTRILETTMANALLRVPLRLGLAEPRVQGRRGAVKSQSRNALLP